MPQPNQAPLHRHAPRPLPSAGPIPATEARMRRSRQAAMFAGVPEARSPTTSFGFRRERPRRPGRGGMASISPIAGCESRTLAGGRLHHQGHAAGFRQDVVFQLFFAQSVRFGPVCPPQKTAWFKNGDSPPSHPSTTTQKTGSGEVPVPVFEPCRFDAGI